MNHEILNNTEYLFSIALKKTGNLTEAEDLTQEVLLAALSYLKSGGVIANMPAWLSATLNHKWNDMLRKKFLGSKSIELHVYDTQPDLNKYEHGPVEIHDDNLCKLLFMIHQGISFDDTGFNLMFVEDIPHLAECGVLRYENDKPAVAIPVISKTQYGELWQVITKYINQFADVLEGALREVLPKLKLPIPQHLEGRVAEFRKYTCYALPIVIIKKAISEGEFLQNIDYPTPPMVLVIEQ